MRVSGGVRDTSQHPNAMNLNPFEAIKELINEHGSSTILRERLQFIEAKYVALEKQCADLKAEKKAQDAHLEQLRHDLGLAQRELQALRERGPRCAQCGSVNLKITGTQPHPNFGVVGGIQYRHHCLDCAADTLILHP